MASLNTSSEGPSITRSYQSIVNAPAPTGPAASSQTYGQWAVFVVQAPLQSAFQSGPGKESVLKVQSTGEGELADLIDEFNDGRIQFAFVKVKDSNSSLPKNVLIAWCGEGVPERTKGYFGSHLEAVSKLLHGYHVQVTARSDRDLTPESIVQKVADASGSKYSGGSAMGSGDSGASRPPVASKPVFQPTRVGGGGSTFSPPGGRSRAPASGGQTDADGWGNDAPELTRTQLEKVESAYKPTKVNIAELQKQHQPARYQAEPRANDSPADVVKGAYQPIGKVDIAAIRKQAQESGQLRDDRPTTVKGSYEPVGKVDIAAIKAKAQRPDTSNTPAPSSMSPARTGDDDEAPKSLADRSAAFQQSERLTSMPKPKVANRFSGSGTFSGTKAPTPGGFSSSTPQAAAPVGAASKNFADAGGMTPAQQWAAKKARERGSSITSGSGNTSAPPIAAQTSGGGGGGGWQSGYTGKKWAAVSTNPTGRSTTSDLSAQRTGDQDEGRDEESEAPSGGAGSVRDRFAGSAPMPPPMDVSSKPNAGARGVPMPGLPTRNVPSDEHVSIPPPPAVPRATSPDDEEEAGDDDEYAARPSSPIRVAMPVSRTKEPEMEPAEELHSPPPMPTASMAAAARNLPPPLPGPSDEAEEEAEAEEPVRAAQEVAKSTFGASAANAQPPGREGSKRALVQFDYEKAEDNEIELREGSYVTNIDMVDEDWWMGTNEQGEVGLFPSNYVEIVDDDDAGAGAADEPGPAPTQPREPAVAPAAGPAGGGEKKLPTATAQYDYEAAEDNELSFPDGATITNVEFPDEDWWLGEYGGKQGLFPANYVTLDE